MLNTFGLGGGGGGGGAGPCEPEYEVIQLKGVTVRVDLTSDMQLAVSLGSKDIEVSTSAPKKIVGAAGEIRC